MELAGRLKEGLTLGQDRLGAVVELDLVGAFQHVAEIMRARMAMRRRAPTRRDVERDHHHFAARDVGERLLHELAHLGGRRLLLRRDSAVVKRRGKRNEAEKHEGGPDEPMCGYKHMASHSNVGATLVVAPLQTDIMDRKTLEKVPASRVLLTG